MQCSIFSNTARENGFRNGCFVLPDAAARGRRPPPPPRCNGSSLTPFSFSFGLQTFIQTRHSQAWKRRRRAVARSRVQFSQPTLVCVDHPLKPAHFGLRAELQPLFCGRVVVVPQYLLCTGHSSDAPLRRTFNGGWTTTFFSPTSFPVALVSDCVLWCFGFYFLFLFFLISYL